VYRGVLMHHSGIRNQCEALIVTCSEPSDHFIIRDFEVLGDGSRRLIQVLKSEKKDRW
jgi:hypothetical protein